MTNDKLQICSDKSLLCSLRVLCGEASPRKLLVNPQFMATSDGQRSLLEMAAPFDNIHVHVFTLPRAVAFQQGFGRDFFRVRPPSRRLLQGEVQDCRRNVVAVIDRIQQSSFGTPQTTGDGPPNTRNRMRPDLGATICWLHTAITVRADLATNRRCDELQVTPKITCPLDRNLSSLGDFHI